MYLTYLGGNVNGVTYAGINTTQTAGTEMDAVALDANGNVYMTGVTVETNLPTTNGVVGPTASCVAAGNQMICSPTFVASEPYSQRPIFARFLILPAANVGDRDTKRCRAGSVRGHLGYRWDDADHAVVKLPLVSEHPESERHADLCHNISGGRRRESRDFPR